MRALEQREGPAPVEARLDAFVRTIFVDAEHPDTVVTEQKLGPADLRALRVKEKDFDDFDMILAMDWDNLSALQQMAPKRTHHKLQLLMRFATEHETATIPDPYYGNAQGFEQVLDYIEDACAGLLELATRRATQVAAA